MNSLRYSSTVVKRKEKRKEKKRKKLNFLRKLKKAKFTCQVLANFCREAIGSILTANISIRYGSRRDRL